MLGFNLVPVSRVSGARFAEKSSLSMSAVAVDPAIGIKVLPMRFRKATKQLATLGLASNSFEMIEKLFLSGNPNESNTLSFKSTYLKRNHTLQLLPLHDYLSLHVINEDHRSNNFRIDLSFLIP